MSSSNKNFVSELSERFPEVSISHRKVKISHDVHVFIVEVQNEELLSEIWKRLRDYIAVYFQNTMESDFERWNLYLIYVCRDEISKELKYKIENDRVSSRKIVVDKYKLKLTSESISSLIDRYINFSFTLPIESKETIGSYTSNSTIYQLIEEKKMSKTKNRDKDLKHLYSKIIDELS